MCPSELDPKKYPTKIPAFHSRSSQTSHLHATAPDLLHLCLPPDDTVWLTLPSKAYWISLGIRTSTSLPDLNIGWFWNAFHKKANQARCIKSKAGWLRCPRWLSHLSLLILKFDWHGIVDWHTLCLVRIGCHRLPFRSCCFTWPHHLRFEQTARPGLWPRLWDVENGWL